jgi:hypothetical protein
MTDNELLEAEGMQAEQERHRIAPPRNPDEILSSPRTRGERCPEVLK